MASFLLHCGTAGGLLLTFSFLYYLCFKHSTYLGWNRIVLWLMACAVVILPLVHLPSNWTIWGMSTQLAIKPEKVQTITPEPPAIEWRSTTKISHGNPPRENASPSVAQYWQPSLTELLICIYGLGVMAMLFRFLLQCGSLFQLYRKASLEHKVGYKLAICEQALTPFAFGSTIFVPRDLLATEQFELVLTHELAHVQQKHSWDILLAEWMLIWQWFNPGAWLYRRLVETNLEYLADRSVLQQKWNKKQYQLSLLNWATSPVGNSLANTYHFSPLKERIMMMNRKPSPKTYLLSYAIIGLILPLFTTFNQPTLRGKEAAAVGVSTQALDQKPMVPVLQESLHKPVPKIEADKPKLVSKEKTLPSLDTIPTQKSENKYFVLVFSPSIDDKEQKELIKSVLAVGKKLEFIRTAGGKIIGGKISEGGGNCSVWHDEDNGLPIVMYGQPGGCSTESFSESFLDKLINNQPITPQLIAAGLPKDKAGLEALRPKIIAHFQKENKERLDHLALNNWIESTNSGSTSYRIPIQEKSWESIKNKINTYEAKGKEYIISINGHQFQSTLPEIDLTKVKKMILYEGQRIEYVPGTLKVKHTESANLRLEIDMD